MKGTDALKCDGFVSGRSKIPSHTPFFPHYNHILPESLQRMNQRDEIPVSRYQTTMSISGLEMIVS
jgi:hypothetical protein